MAVVHVGKAIEFTLKPWGAGLATSNGVQYGGVVNVTPANSAQEAVWHTINTDTINIIPEFYPGGEGRLKELEVGLTLATKSPDNATAQIVWMLRGRDERGAPAWKDLCAQQTQAGNANPWYDMSISGLMPIQTNFNRTPFQLGIVANANVGSVFQVKIKNSSYVRAKYTID